MFSTRTKLLVLAVVAAASLLAAGDVEAFWHRWCGGRGGYSAGYSSYSAGYGSYSAGYGSYYAPACSSCATYAPACSSCAIDAPACSSCATDASAYSNGATSAPACSSCPGGSCSTSYYETYPSYSAPVSDTGCSSCQASTIRAGAPAWSAVLSTPGPAAVAAPAPAPMADDPSTRIVFTVRVPADATVYVNDRPTTTPGTDRTFIARGLNSGSLYGFTVRTERAFAGRTVSETQVLRLTPGQTGQLAFVLQPASAVASRQVRPLVTLVSSH